jgi:hypothetical protein
MREIAKFDSLIDKQRAFIEVAFTPEIAKGALGTLQALLSTGASNFQGGKLFALLGAALHTTGP